MGIFTPPAVIVPAFSRGRALERLLHSLEVARYPCPIDLVISLDGGFTSEVEAVAERFKQVFSHGQVAIVKRIKNIGLKNHILWCGAQAETYGAVIVLEDDLVVSEHFYMYAIAAINYFHGDERVSGISLYAQRFNEYANLPFEPSNTKFENYFMQVACSWGQVWTARQWLGFKQWFDGASDDNIQQTIALPEYVKRWPASSWKKYFSAYLVQNGKYFVYPYSSYTSNCGDKGGHHNRAGSNILQVPLLMATSKQVDFNFVNMDQGGAKYDSFMEPQHLQFPSDLGPVGERVEIDLYGSKPLALLRKTEFCLTTKKSRSPIRAFPLKFRPIENNLLYSEEADGVSGIVLTRSQDIDSDFLWRVRYRHYLLATYFSYFNSRSKSYVFMSLYDFYLGGFNKLTNSLPEVFKKVEQWAGEFKQYLKSRP